MHSENNNLNIYNQRISPMKDHRYYSIDDRLIYRKAEETMKERPGTLRSKKMKNKIE